MKPIGKYIVIKKIEEEVKTESGILLSSEDVSSMRYQKGKVVKPGTLVDTIKEKDIIYYDKAAGHSMLINDFVYTVISERDVVVVV
jgi:co-chaperonin GroES (HSP10)|tara:strand:- start:1047 stop:1304 length:258 start_codon:yes stop_codon:yes gene_type:complete